MAYVKSPVFKEERYQAEVPDTLDLAERAELALSGLSRTTDPDDGYMQYFLVYLNTRPPYMQHNGPEVKCTAKFADAIPRLRFMCGSDRFRDVEQGMLDELVSYLSEEDGQIYNPYDPKRPWHMRVYSVEPVADEPFTYPVASGVMMLVLMTRREVDNTTRWDGHIERLARGLEQIAIHKDDYAFYPEGLNGGFCRRRSGWDKSDEPGDELEGGEGSVVSEQGYQILGLSMWAGLTGDEQALDFAGKLSRFTMKPKFWGGVSDAIQCSAAERGHSYSHFHARGLALKGLMEYGLVANEPRVCDFVRSAYEYMRSFGVPELGLIPTFYPRRRRNMNGYMEGCFLRDVLWMAVKLSESGYGDFWEDVDRTVRNILVEDQFTDKAMLERIVAHSPERTPDSDYNPWLKGSTRPNVPYPGQEHTGDDVIDRMLGIFGSLPSSSSIDFPWVMQCCSPNAAIGLYYAWEAITRLDGDHARVNLFLNRAAPWLDVDSYLPYEGRVVIRNKTARRLSVRVPPWVRRSELEWRVGGELRRPDWLSTYGMLGELRPQDVVELRFPLKDRTVTTVAHASTDKETEHTLRIRGNTVVDISPRDESPGSYQFYRRDHMKAPRAPMKSVTRYVAPVIPGW